MSQEEITKQDIQESIQAFELPTTSNSIVNRVPKSNNEVGLQKQLTKIFQNFKNAFKRIKETEAHIKVLERNIDDDRKSIKEQVKKLGDLEKQFVDKIEIVNTQVSWSNGWILGAVFAFLFFSCSLWYAHFETMPKLENQINIQQEKIQNLEDDIKELKDIINKYFIK